MFTIIFMGIHLRVKKIMESKNLNYRSFGQLLDYSDTQVRNIIIGKSIPKVDFVEKIVILFPDINTDWLITGKGNMDNKGNLNSFSKEDLLDYIILNSEEFRNEPKIDAVTALFFNFEQQRELKRMYERLDSYEVLLKKIVENK